MTMQQLFFLQPLFLPPSTRVGLMVLLKGQSTFCLLFSLFSSPLSFFPILLSIFSILLSVFSVLLFVFSIPLSIFSTFSIFCFTFVHFYFMSFLLCFLSFLIYFLSFQFYFLSFCSSIYTTEIYRSLLYGRCCGGLSAVSHIGARAVGGHYTADIFHPGYNCWIRCDDGIITSVPVSAVTRFSSPKVPYLIFYRRLDLS